MTLGAFQRDGDLSVCFDGDVVLTGPATLTGNLEIRARNIEVQGAVTVHGGRLLLLPTTDVHGFGGMVRLASGARLNSNEILIGGDAHGRGALPHARAVRIDAGAVLCADADGSGAGGRIVIWSDEKTEFHGSISARGGERSGDGGWVEVSSRGVLDFAGHVDTSATAGHNGTLLLDPNTINIVGAVPDLNGDGTVGDDISSSTSLNNTTNFPGKTSVITVGALKTVLAGSDVTLASTVAVNWTAVLDINGLGVAGRTLTITSAVITIQDGGVTDSNPATADKLNVTLTAVNTLDVFGSLSTGGGNVTLTAGSGGGDEAIRIGATTTIQTGIGNITLTGIGAIEGIHVAAGAKLLSQTGALSLTGTATGNSAFTHGIYFSGDTAITQVGNVALLGTGANAGAGIYFEGAVHIESTSGTCSVTGTGTCRHGLFISDVSSTAIAKAVYFAGAAGLTVTGNGTEFGIYTPGHGPDPLTLTSADYGTAMFISSAGPVAISGDATVAPGTTTNGTGRHGFQVNGACSITGAGNVSLSGSGTEFGVMVLQGLTITSSAGTTTVAANSTGRHGLHAVSSLLISGDQGVSVTANSTQFGIESDGSGSFTSAKGPVSVSAISVEGPADAVLNSMVPVQTRGEGKRGIHLADATVHGKGNVSITASATEAAIDSGNFSVTSDTGTVTIDGQVAVGTGILPGDAPDAIKVVSGALTVQAGGNVLLKARSQANGIVAPTISVTSDNGAVTLDSDAPADALKAYSGGLTVKANGDALLKARSSFNGITSNNVNVTSTSGAVTVDTTGPSIALKSSDNALSLHGKSDVTITAQSNGTGVESRGISLISSNGKVAVNPTGGGGIGNHVLHWAGGAGSVQAAGDITLVSPIQITGDGLSATSSAGGISITANGASGGLKCGFQGVTLTAANDISVDLRCTQYETLSSGDFTATSTAGAVSLNSLSNTGNSGYGNVKVSGRLSLSAAQDVNVTANGYAPFYSGGLSLTSTSGKVTLASTSTDTNGDSGETLTVSGTTTVQAAGDISFTGTHGRVPMFLNDTASFTSTGGAVTVNGSLPTTSSNFANRAGILCGGALTLQGDKDVALSGRGAAFGLQLNNDLTLKSSTGKVTVLGDATVPAFHDSTGIELNGALTINAQSDVSLIGNGSMFGTKFLRSSSVTSAAGEIVLLGDASALAPSGSQCAYGVLFNQDSTLKALNDIAITGKSGRFGILAQGTPAYTSLTGKLTLLGDCNATTGEHVTGVILGHDAALKSGGDLSVSGNGTTNGLFLPSNSTFTSTSGGVTLVGDCTVNSQNTNGFRGRSGLELNFGISPVLTINALGDISITGKGGQFGMTLPCVNTYTSTAGKITIIGDGTANNSGAGRYGMDLQSLTASAATGISLTGKGTEFGVNLYGNAPLLATTGGTLVISGDATAAPANYLSYTDGVNTYTEVPTGRHGIVSPAGIFSGGDGVSINGTASEFGLALYGLAPQIVSTNGAVTVNVNASHPIPAATAAALGGNIPPEQSAPEGRHAFATESAFSIQAKTGVSMIGTANVFALDFQSDSTISASAGPVTLLGISADYSGIVSQADITGVGVGATGISSSTDAGISGIEIKDGTVDGTSGLVNFNGTATSGASDSTGVKFSGGIVKTSVAGPGIQITGTAPSYGATVLAGATLDGGGNPLTLSGTSNGAFTPLAAGIYLDDGDPAGATVQSLGGSVKLIGVSNFGDGIRIGNAGVASATVDAGAGSLTLSADTVNLVTGTNAALRGTGGTLTIAPLSAALPIVVGGTGASDAVYLGQSEINEIKNGFAFITIGRTDGGALTVPLNGTTGATFSSKLTLLTGAQLDVVGPLKTTAGSGGGITLKHGGLMTVETSGLVSGDGGVFELGTGAVILKNAISSSNSPIIITGSTTAVDNLTLSAGTGSVTFKGQVSPGLSGPGRLNITGDLVIASSGAYFADIATPIVGGFDQIVTSGKVTVGGQLLGTAVGPYLTSNVFPIILNNSTSPVSGAFTNLAELGSVQLGSVTFNGSYRAGDNNDVVLGTDEPAVIASPGTSSPIITQGTNFGVTAMINDPEGDPLTTVYSYGDGTSDGLGTHTYTTGGHYTITIATTDGIFTTTKQIDVDVVALVPFPAAITATFAPAGKSADSLKITGTIPFLVGTVLTDKVFTLQIGSHSEAITLKKTGAGTSVDKKAKISMKLPKKKVTGLSTALFTFTIKKVEYGDLIGQTTQGTVPVVLAVNFLNSTLIDTISLTVKPKGKNRAATGKYPN